jgi:hypothetical protein
MRAEAEGDRASDALGRFGVYYRLTGRNSIFELNSIRANGAEGAYAWTASSAKNAAALMANYSHSMVPGGFDVMS